MGEGRRETIRTALVIELDRLPRYGIARLPQRFERERSPTALDRLVGRTRFGSDEDASALTLSAIRDFGLNGLDVVALNHATDLEGSCLREWIAGAKNDRFYRGRSGASALPIKNPDMCNDGVRAWLVQCDRDMNDRSVHRNIETFNPDIRLGRILLPTIVNITRSLSVLKLCDIFVELIGDAAEGALGSICVLARLLIVHILDDIVEGLPGDARVLSKPLSLLKRHILSQERKGGTGEGECSQDCHGLESGIGIHIATSSGTRRLNSELRSTLDISTGSSPESIRKQGNCYR